jgi:hypothetical protein
VKQMFTSRQWAPALDNGIQTIQLIGFQADRQADLVQAAFQAGDPYVLQRNDFFNFPGWHEYA